MSPEAPLRDRLVHVCSVLDSSGRPWASTGNLALLPSPHSSASEGLHLGQLLEAAHMWEVSVQASGEATIVSIVPSPQFSRGLSRVTASCPMHKPLAVLTKSGIWQPFRDAPDMAASSPLYLPPYTPGPVSRLDLPALSVVSPDPSSVPFPICAFSQLPLSILTPSSLFGGQGT